MIVTSLEPVTKTKYKVFLDGQFAFVLYKGELVRYDIQAGKTMEEDVVEKIQKDVICKRAKLRAMHLLEDMDRTEQGLRDKLKQGLYTQQVIEAAIQYVKSFGYLDDTRYARQFIESRMRTKSRREIYALLCGKGIDSDIIESAFDACCIEDKEQETIRCLIQKRRIDIFHATPEELHKLYGYLARKGFGYEDIRQVIQNYKENA